MEDKTFELLTKMYNEFSEKFDKIDGKVDKLEKEMKETNTRLTKIELCIENEIKPDIKAALEGYQMVYEELSEKGKSIEIINNKLEKQDVEITVIKGGIKEVL